MRNKFSKLTVAAVASLFAAPAAMASTITVDDFQVSQQVADVPGTGQVQESVVSGDPGVILGGTRYLKVETAPDVNGNSITGGTTLNSEFGFLRFNNESAVTGIGYVVYDGTTDRSAATNTDIGVGVNTTGLANKDLIGAFSPSETFFSFDLSEFNPGTGGSTALFSAYAWDMEDGFGRFDEVVGSGPISPLLFLSEFSGSVDWANVGALAFSIDSRDPGDGSFGGTNFDGRVGPVTISAVPLPASVLLLLGGLGGFAGLSAVARRRKNA